MIGMLIGFSGSPLDKVYNNLIRAWLVKISLCTTLNDVIRLLSEDFVLLMLSVGILQSKVMWI